MDLSAFIGVDRRLNMVFRRNGMAIDSRIERRRTGVIVKRFVLMVKLAVTGIWPVTATEWSQGPDSEPRT